jgi:hypothetical protein
MSVKSKNLESFIVIPENEVLLLDDSESLWIIESGSMTVYAAKVQDGLLQSTRRYLFEVETGEALFGFAVGDVQNSTPLDAMQLQTGHLSFVEGGVSPSLLGKGLESHTFYLYFGSCDYTNQTLADKARGIRKRTYF